MRGAFSIGSGGRCRSTDEQGDSMLIDLIQLEFIMVLLVAAGIYLRRRSVITDEGRDCLSDLLTMLILPCNIFLSFEGNTDMSALKSSLLTVIISVLVMLCTAILGKVIYRHREERKAKVFRYGLVNSNALFIGLPIIQSLLGDAGVLQLSMYMIFARMFCWSYGLSLYTGVKSDWKGSFKRLLTHPCMIAAALGVAAMVTGIRLPAFLDRTLQYVSSCLMALSMLLIGVVLSEIKLKEVFCGDVWRFTALRLGVMPGIVFGLCKLCGVPYIVTATCTLVSGMPAASLTAVLAARYHGDSELGALLVAVSTILSAVTIPLWFMILQ